MGKTTKQIRAKERSDGVWQKHSTTVRVVRPSRTFKIQCACVRARHTGSVRRGRVGGGGTVNAPFTVVTTSWKRKPIGLLFIYFFFSSRPDNPPIFVDLKWSHPPASGFLYKHYPNNILNDPSPDHPRNNIGPQACHLMFFFSSKK